MRKSKLFSILFWLSVWYIISLFINDNILLASPIEVFTKVYRMFFELSFYYAVFISLIRILLGFILSLIFSLIMSVLSVKYKFIEDLLKPVVFVLRSMPLASFVVLILFWVSGKNLSVVVCFFMVFPIFYENIKKGILNCNKNLIEMVQLFNLNNSDKIKYIYFSEVLPYFQSAASLAIGYSFKAGIAAEIIGLPRFSIGESLLESKMMFDVSEVMAWSVVVVLLSVIIEKIFMKVLDKLVKKVLVG